MADFEHDGAFLALARTLRPGLEACARLLYPDQPAARSGSGTPLVPLAARVVSQALARAYATWYRVEPSLAAYRALLQPDWRLLTAPGDLDQLIDVAPHAHRGLVDDLARVETRQRQALVLVLVAGLPLSQSAAVLELSPSAIAALVNAGGEELVGVAAFRQHPGELAGRLRAAAQVPLHAAEQTDPDDANRSALARGRQLVRGQRRRGLLATATIGVLSVLAVGLLVSAARSQPTGGPVPAPAPAPLSPVSPSRSLSCDPADSACREELTNRWRATMSAVLTEHLDPERRYFSGYSYAYSASYDSEGLWHGDGGALALELYRLDDGATEVYLQIATAGRFADRCGARTGHRCQSIPSMNGNGYLVTETMYASDGIEVQFAADTDAVITVVARDVSDGRHLELSEPELVALVQDPRLRLPPI